MAKFSKCTLRNKEFIKKINSAAKQKNNRRLSSLISQASRDEIDSITEIALNATKGNIPYSPRSKNKLKSFRNAVRLIAKCSTPIKKKKKIIANWWFFTCSIKSNTCCGCFRIN